MAQSSPRRKGTLGTNGLYRKARGDATGRGSARNDGSMMNRSPLQAFQTTVRRVTEVARQAEPRLTTG